MPDDEEGESVLSQPSATTSVKKWRKAEAPAGPSPLDEVREPLSDKEIQARRAAAEASRRKEPNQQPLPEWWKVRL
eukprot:1184899-Prorocentrum_minimum.AAC.1